MASGEGRTSCLATEAPAAPACHLARLHGTDCGGMELRAAAGVVASHSNRTVTRQVERQFRRNSSSTILTAHDPPSAEIDASGEVLFLIARWVTNAFWNRGSGLYWQIQRRRLRAVAVAKPLWDRTLTLQGVTRECPDHFDRRGCISTIPASLPARSLRMSNGRQGAPGSDTRWTFAVASATEQMDAQNRAGAA